MLCIAAEPPGCLLSFWDYAPSAWPSDRGLFLQPSTSAQAAGPSKASIELSELTFTAMQQNSFAHVKRSCFLVDARAQSHACLACLQSATATKPAATKPATI